MAQRDPDRRADLRAARGAIDAEPVEPLVLKGKTQSVVAFRLSRRCPGAQAIERRLDTPLVGRGREPSDCARRSMRRSPKYAAGW